MAFMQELPRIIFIGAGATLIMDIWLMFLSRLGIPSLNFAYLGRWVGHLIRGRVAHASIAKSAQIPGEALLGWSTHYAVGIACASGLVVIFGGVWLTAPSLLPAMVVGVGTVAFPFFVMQPAMGSGVAASKTDAPLANRARSIVNHAVFGLGLYLSALLLEWICQAIG